MTKSVEEVSGGGSEVRLSSLETIPVFQCLGRKLFYSINIRNVAS